MTNASNNATLAVAVLLAHASLRADAATREFAKIKKMFPGIKGMVVDNGYGSDEPPFGQARVSILYDPTSHDEQDYVDQLPFVQGCDWPQSEKLAEGVFITTGNTDAQGNLVNDTEASTDDVDALLASLLGAGAMIGDDLDD